MATYERAFKDKNARDKLVQPHKFQGQWAQILYDNAQKESKRFGPYQGVQKMLLGAYRLHDPNDRELAALVHGNLLIEATVSTVDELKALWASPNLKNVLRNWNKRMKVLPSYPENTDILDEDLLNDDDEKETIVPEIVKKSLKRNVRNKKYMMRSL